MGGPVYRYDPNLDSDRKWPAFFDSKALFGEWNQNNMYTFQLTPDGRSLVDIKRSAGRDEVQAARWTWSSGRTARCT